MKSLDFRGKQTLNSKGWEFSCPLNFIGSLPESLTQGLLIGKLLIGGLGVADVWASPKDVQSSAADRTTRDMRGE